MKKILFIITIAVLATSCFTDPVYMVKHETAQTLTIRKATSLLVAERYARPDTNTVCSIITCRYGNGSIDTVYIYQSEW